MSEWLRIKVVKGEKKKKNKVGKQPSNGEENLPLRFQVKYFLKAVSNKEPAL